jgi:hypothetical protein
MMRAATAHVGNFWPLRRQKSKMELVNASMLVVSTTTPMQPAAGLVLLGIHRRAVAVLDGVQLCRAVAHLGHLVRVRVRVRVTVREGQG